MKLLISNSDPCNVKHITLKVQNSIKYNVPQIYSFLYTENMSLFYINFPSCCLASAMNKALCYILCLMNGGVKKC